MPLFFGNRLQTLTKKRGIKKLPPGGNLKNDAQYFVGIKILCIFGVQFRNYIKYEQELHHARHGIPASGGFPILLGHLRYRTQTVREKHHPEGDVSAGGRTFTERRQCQRVCIERPHRLPEPDTADDVH